LVEEGFEAALRRKYNPNSARPRIFDGAAEAKLIGLACGPAPSGYARWILSLLEEKVVELNIVGGVGRQDRRVSGGGRCFISARWTAASRRSETRRLRFSTREPGR
jgi:hypothetical protein